MRSRIVLITSLVLLVVTSGGSSLAQDGPTAPGLGDTDGWVDAAGDRMFGNLTMGPHAIEFEEGSLQNPPGSRTLTFGANTLCMAQVEIPGCGSIESITVGSGLRVERSGGAIRISMADPLPAPRVWSGYCSIPVGGTATWAQYCLDREGFSTFEDNIVVETDGTIQILLPGIYQIHVQGRAQPINNYVGVRVSVNDVVRDLALESTGHQHNHVFSDLLWELHAGDTVRASFLSGVWEGPLHSRLQIEYLGLSTRG